MGEEPIGTTLYSLSDSVPSQTDRREDERYLTLFRVGSLTIGDRRELCLVKNVSAGGMRVRAYSDLEPGTAVSVELKHGQPIGGSVSWADSSSVGIAFDQRIDVVELLTASADGPRPRMPRVEIRCMASIRVESQVYGMLALDISQGGVKVESRQSLPVGCDAVVTLPGLLPQAGVVRWQHNGCHGITFNRLLALEDLVGWLQGLRESPAATGTG